MYHLVRFGEAARGGVGPPWLASVEINPESWIPSTEPRLAVKEKSEIVERGDVRAGSGS